MTSGFIARRISGTSRGIWDQVESGKHKDLAGRAAMERKEEQETCPTHIISYERELSTMNNYSGRDVGVANDFILNAHTCTHRKKNKTERTET